MHTKCGRWPPQDSCYLGGVRGCPPHRAKRAVVQIQGGAYTRRCPYKAVDTQGAAHKRPFVATARVLLLRGDAGVLPAWSEGSRSPHTRRCIHKAVHIQRCAHTQGAAHRRRSVPTARVLLFRGRARVSPASSEGSRSPHTRRCMHRAVHIQGGAHTRRYTQKAVLATAGVLLLRGPAGVSPASSEAIRSPYTRWCIHKAVHIQRYAHTR